MHIHPGKLECPIPLHLKNMNLSYNTFKAQLKTTYLIQVQTDSDVSMISLIFTYIRLLLSALCDVSYILQRYINYI